MQPVIQINQEDNKWDIRHKVWDYIENKNLANFPRPVHNRIPNFKDASHACNRLTDLHKFRSSRVVKVNPDRPQEQSRFITLFGALEACSVLSNLEAFTKTTAVKVDPDKPLEGVRLAALQAGKTLLVPTPRLKTGLFNKIVPPQGATKQVLHVCSTSQGIKQFSVPVGLEDSVQVNLVVIGSVAVSENGYRIGKGEGFADMEYAMMACMGAVCDSTVIVTIVHDCQVMDIPEKLIEDHDLTVDFILTPTRIIQTECERPKPQGIIWSKLDTEVLTKIPILKKLRLLEQNAGKDVTLKTPPAGEYENNNLQDACQSKIQPELKWEPNCDPKSKQQQQQGHLTYEDDKHARFKDKLHICPSSIIYLGDIPARLRVSELKNLLKEQEAVPLRINWQGAQQRAFLHYADSARAEHALQALKTSLFTATPCELNMPRVRNPKKRRELR